MPAAPGRSVSRATRLALLLLVLAACRPDVQAVRAVHPATPAARRVAPAANRAIFARTAINPPAQAVAEPAVAAREPSAPREPGTAREAVAMIAPTRGSAATGSVRFREVEGGVELVARIENLAGRHVYNIHVHGDCTAPDASSAGPLLDVTARVGDTVTHDLGVLRDQGRLTAIHDTRIETVSLDALVGRSIVVMSRSDNPYIAPNKRTDIRVGCGVIKALR
ncbi:MAG: hypothetical protein H6Q90_5741 [Deltaproteobacteria bacterium]|nr:hypothetical protein [Deltaproteobacteria bacterium]